jgi:hypothetical protein
MNMQNHAIKRLCHSFIFLKMAALVILGCIVAVNVDAWQMKQAALMTPWAALVDTNNPLPEYPRPQLVRTNWLNLNGIWQFQPGATYDPVPTGQTLSSQILVPYPMESAISGVMQYNEFSWYRQLFTVPAVWSGKRIILHLDAVDWRATVYVNGQNVGTHKGGYDPFSYDITPFLNGGTNELIVQVYSPEDNGSQPRGKQTLYPGGIMYTSCSGIWQPVWLEPVDASGVNNLQIVPDVDNSQLRLTVNTYATSGVTVVATVLSNDVAINTMTGNPQTELDIPIPNPKLWSPNSPFLYDLQVSVVHNGVTNDFVTSYFGMRKIAINMVGGIPKIYLNNQFIFGMGPLDQGFWPDGIYTAPTDAALAYDIQMEKALGFNTVRKHIKVERQRWYYWADKLGIMVWQDMPSCNSYTGNPTPPPVDPLDFIAELSAMVTNHWNSPAIIMWDLFNESQGQTGSGAVGQTNTAYLVQTVKTLDPSRLVNQASGGSYFGVGDVLDAHSYPNPGDPISTTQAPVDGEFGGIAWHVNGHLWNPAQAGTGYLLASSLDNFASLYDGYINEAINFKPTANGGLNAAIYTQITDVENECNGLMSYDRLVKPDMDRIFSSNLKAITGQMTVTPVVPTSQTVPQTWLWTTNTPASNWYATNFNATGWSTGVAGFGTIDPGVTPNTAWTSLGYIYLRRTFNPGSLPPQLINDLGFTVYHDEDVAIYINGVFAASAPGYTTAYVNLPMTPQAQAAIIPNGTNLMAVSCYQTTGGQFIDVGISDQQLIANTFTVPTDEIGYWPLDATSGTVAVDATGDGYNGTVYGAMWNPNGKVNGCLNFNGLNNYVQIPNPVSSDFSIVFWVKSTQTTGGTGQWYNGTGLVDGDYPGVTNDFGTALLGNKLAFGVGNPDTTILSTSPINDGNWHQCVATRVQSTGVISLYMDGTMQATGTGNTNKLNASSFLTIGRIASGGGYFNGSLDEIDIFNRAMGNNEVTALYNNSVFPQMTPTILLPPASQTRFVGGLASFSAQAIGGNLNYQWYFGSAPILNATNNTLILTNVTSANAGSYSILVSNAAGSVTNSVTLTAVTPTNSLLLLHRYSFISDASDSVGGANGTIVAPNGGGAATINHGLSLPGSTTPAFGYSGYLSLPSGLLTATTNLTVECWVTQNQGNVWAEIWDFGNSGSQNFGLIPYPNNNNHNLEVAFTPNGGEQDLQSAVSFPNGSEQYVCVIYNAYSLVGNLYTNGTLVALLTFPNSTYTPGTIGGTGGTTENMLGNDVYGDYQFSGTVYEFRIWNGVVSPLYLAVSAAAGPSVVATNLTPLSLNVTITNSSMGAGFTQPASVIGAFAGASGVPVTGFVTNWSSSNPGVISVNGSGLITAVNTGSATISAILNGVTGTSASLTVTSSPPVITQEPVAAETLLAGATFNTSVANSGNPPFVYRWYFNNGGNPISTAATPTLTIGNLQLTNAGSYTCVVSNQYGTAPSTPLNLTVLAPTTYQQSLLSLNPIAYWPLNETKGTIAHDLIGNDNGAYIGGFTLAQAGPTNAIFGSPSQSALFNGTSGYVDIPEGPFNITGALSVMAWVDVLTVPGFAGLFGHGDPSWRMSINSSGEPSASDGSAPDATAPSSIVDGNWHLVAYTCAGIPGINNGLLYVDGLLVASDSVTSPLLGDNLDVWIGGSPDYGAARLLNAKIAHAAIFTEALTAAQVQDLYTGTYAAPVNLVVTRSGLSVVLNWPAGVLLQAPNLTGPWTTNSAAVSPYTVTAASGNQFFKLLVSP